MKCFTGCVDVYLLSKALTWNFYNASFVYIDVFVGGLVERCQTKAVRLPYIYCLDESGNRDVYTAPHDNSMTPLDIIFIKHYVKKLEDMRYHFDTQRERYPRLIG